MTKVSVTVDPSLCELAGYCERIADTVFSIQNGSASSQVEQPVVSDPALVRLVLEAESTCPGRAIRVEKLDDS